MKSTIVVHVCQMNLFYVLILTRLARQVTNSSQVKVMTLTFLIQKTKVKIKFDSNIYPLFRHPQKPS